MSTFPHAKRKNTLKALLIWAVLMVPASAMLYSASAHVRELQKQMAALDAQMASEKESIRVLNAEWAYLNNPELLASRAKKYLGFGTLTSSKQIARFDDLSVKIALRDATPADAPSSAVAQNAVYPAPAVAPASAENVAMANPAQAPAKAAPSTRMLASPIAYSSQLVDALREERNVKLPAAASWHEKVAGILNISANTERGRITP